jgi:CRP-like cAMP-binding protein
VLNHSTSRAEVDRAVELAETLVVETGPPSSEPVHISYPELGHGWLRRPTLDAEGLRSLPLFRTLGDDLCERVLLAAREHLAVRGEPVVEQWQATRDLFVVMEGGVQVIVDGSAVATLGPGEFFGELAAIDWGAGFGRTRTATVVASAESRLLVLDWTLVNALMKADSTLSATLEQTARDRLANH